MIEFVRRVKEIVVYVRSLRKNSARLIIILSLENLFGMSLRASEEFMLVHL
jgi:hypothetical protein